MFILFQGVFQMWRRNPGSGSAHSSTEREKPCQSEAAVCCGVTSGQCLLTQPWCNWHTPCYNQPILTHDISHDITLMNPMDSWYTQWLSLMVSFGPGKLPTERRILFGAGTAPGAKLAPRQCDGFQQKGRQKVCS